MARPGTSKKGAFGLGGYGAPNSRATGDADSISRAGAAACNALVAKLRPAQKAAYDYIKSKQSKHVVIAFHRRGGKSYLAATLLCEAAMSEPDYHIIYAAPKLKNVRIIAMPILRQILRDVPEELHPRFDKGDNTLTFPNGSTVLFAGVELGQADSPRGASCRKFFFDEEGYADDPEYFIQDVILPMINETKGQIIHLSTPAQSPSHPFCQLMAAAKEGGYLFTMPATENPLIAREELDSWAAELGGWDSTTFRREYLCEVVTEEKFAIFPELIPRKDRARPDLSDESVTAHGAITCAASIDFTGLTVLLWGCYHERRNEYWILDEHVVLNGSVSDLLAAHSIRGDADWGGVPIIEADSEGLSRVLSSYGVPTSHRDAFDLQANLGFARHLVSNGKLRVHPRCATLLRHAFDGIWDKEKRQFALSGDGGRFDAVRALALLLSATQRFQGSAIVPDAGRRSGLSKIGDVYGRR